MKDLFIFFTKSTEVYPDLFEGKLFNNTSVETGGDTLIISKGFHRDDLHLAHIYFDTKSCVQQEFQKTENHPVLLFHDSISINDVVIKLSNGHFLTKNDFIEFLNNFDNIYIFFHRNAGEEFGHKNILNWIPEGKNVFSDSFSHFTEKENSDNFRNLPFYKLSEIWQCQYKNDFEKLLEEFKSFFLDENNLNAKISVLYKLLRNDDLTGNEQNLIKSIDTDFSVEEYKETYNSNKESALEFLKRLRTKLLQGDV